MRCRSTHFFFASALKFCLHSTKTHLLCLALLLRAFPATQPFPFLEVLDYHHPPLLLSFLALLFSTFLSSFLSSFTKEAASHLRISPYHPVCSCDTTICHEIRTFCLLLCSLFLGVDTIFFLLLFGCVIFSRSVLPSFFRSPLWSVLPSPISRSVCLSNFFFNSFL